MEGISTVIIVFNSQATLRRCIESVLPFSSEIIVVDSFSTDQTEAIAKSYEKVKFYQRPFDDFIQQKNWANSQATGNYIFSLDSDEAATAELASYLLDFKGCYPRAISFPRLNFIGQKAIMSGNWYPDRKIRFWEKSTGNWGGSIPHESLILNKEISTKESDAEILHFAYQSIGQIREKSKKYALLWAPYLKSKHTKVYLLFKMIFSPIFKFIKGFFLKKGYRMGMFGCRLEIELAKETYYKYRFALL